MLRDPVDVVLYLDRLDFYRVERTDQEIMSAITNTFGPKIWRNTIIGLSHGKAVAPRGSPQGIFQTGTVIVNNMIAAVCSGYKLVFTVPHAALCSRCMIVSPVAVCYMICIQCIFAFVHVILLELLTSLFMDTQQNLFAVRCYCISCTSLSVSQSVGRSTTHQLVWHSNGFDLDMQAFSLQQQ